ncbi:DUF1521 domain-containing protein [Ottowia testudinis]|uniref:DUF1521 domain-containing protein n=1 Tax=Ottowia testudinis TaxID=2816950 RepID=A0A975H3R0_9BURK|nr:DUF1521 domain-containing protein [Ottowia testudinis]QTD46143.1 DUF1521 domain-containing protein [Ottowia testudinis]
MFSPTTGFVAIAAVGIARIGDAPPRGPKLPHANRYELGTIDKKGCFCAKSDAQWKVSNPGNGTAKVDLGKYELQMDEKNSQIKIINKQNGEVTNIWGDPHIDWNKDGKTDANFWGTTTFQLEDGTKITIGTEPFKNNPNEYLSSEVTVTRGDHAMKITGLSQNELGDLKVEYADRGGQALDWATPDGFVVRENPNGEGWINAATGKLADQKDFDITKPGAQKSYEFTQEFSQALGLYLATGMLSGVFDLFGLGSSGWQTGRSETYTPPYKPTPPFQAVQKPLAVQRDQVQQPDAQTVTIRHRNGSVDTRSGGSLAWRTNNPALLPYNAATRSLGAIGSADGVAVFRDENAGRNALAKLMLGLPH